MPVPQPVKPRVYSLPSAAPALTGELRLQPAALPVRVKSLFESPVTGPAKTSE